MFGHFFNFKQVEESLGDFHPKAREDEPTIFCLDPLKNPAGEKNDTINMELCKLLGRVDAMSSLPSWVNFKPFSSFFYWSEFVLCKLAAHYSVKPD